MTLIGVAFLHCHAQHLLHRRFCLFNPRHPLFCIRLLQCLSIEVYTIHVLKSLADTQLRSLRKLETLFQQLMLRHIERRKLQWLIRA